MRGKVNAAIRIIVFSGITPAHAGKSRGGIIKSKQGVSGFSLVVAPQDLTLYDVYRAIYETDEVHIYSICIKIQMTSVS